MSFEDFEKKLYEVQKLHDKEIADGKSDFNIFEALKVEQNENRHSLFLSYLLDTKKPHYQDVFARQFLKKLRQEKIVSKSFQQQMLCHKNIVKVLTEVQTKKKKRMDILIKMKNDYFILIENKINYKDRREQIRSYIKDLIDSGGNEKILTIYLTPKQEDVSCKSLCVRGGLRWRIENNEILENSKHKSFYFKMDYQWIQEWLEDCIAILEEKRELQNYENGLSKIIFAIEQYIVVLKEYVMRNSHFEEENPILKLICDERYQQDAFEIFSKKRKGYKIIQDVWNDFEEHIVRDFYNQLEKYMEENPICLIPGKKENWYVSQTQRDNYNTVNQYRLHFFRSSYYFENYWVGFNIFYSKPNFGCPSIDLRVHFADECDSQDNDYDQIKTVVLKELESIMNKQKSKNYNKAKLTYFKKKFLELDSEENLASWILRKKADFSKYSSNKRNKLVIEEFLKKMKSFTMDKDIVETYKTMVRITNREHKGFKQ